MLQKEENAVTPRIVERMKLLTINDMAPNMIPARRNIHQHLVPRLPESNAVFNKQPFFAVDPFLGCDMAVGEALRLTLKVDWLMAIRSTGLNRPLGPRVYFGFIFAH